MTDHALTTTDHRPQRAPMTTGGAVGALVPQTLEEAFRLAQAMAASGMTPRDIDTTEKVLVAIMAGAELGMKPFQAVQSFAIVNGRPSLWGDGLMALALTNGLDVEEWIEGEGDNRVAFCRVTRPDNGKVVTRDYSVEKAKTAKLWGKVSSSGKPSPWVTSPDRMLQMRARSYAIRDAAADVLRGMPIKEEVEDFIEANPGLIDGPRDEPRGTGLLGKLQTAQTLTEVAGEGFGVRNLEQEAGGASAEAEPKPAKRPRKKAVDDALNQAGEELAADAENRERDRVERTANALAFVAEHGRRPTADDFSDTDKLAPLLDSDVGRLDDVLGRVVTQDDVDAQYPAATDPVDALVEELDERIGALETALETPAAAEPEDAQVEELAATEADRVHVGPAPADTVYFLAEDPTFPSGRRPVWFNGLPNGVEDGDADLPTYTQHAPEGAARPTSTASVQPAETGPASSESAPPASSDSAEGTSGQTAFEDQQQSSEPTPFETFDAAMAEAEDGPAIAAAIQALFAAPEAKTPDTRRIPRLKAWARAVELNKGGAKIDPVSNPFLLASYIEAETDAEAVEATLPLARDQEWFVAGGEAMQAGVARAVMDRVTALKGG